MRWFISVTHGEHDGYRTRDIRITRNDTWKIEDFSRTYYMEEINGDTRRLGFDPSDNFREMEKTWHDSPGRMPVELWMDYFIQLFEVPYKKDYTYRKEYTL